MTPQELEILISQGESETVEFKTSFNKEVIEKLVAYANTATFESFDKNALELFTERVKSTGRYNSAESLEEDFKKLSFIKEGKFTRATELLFGLHHTCKFILCGIDKKQCH